MKKNIIIIVSLIITALNLRAYGELDEKKQIKAKEIALTNVDINLEEKTNGYFGLNLFDFVFFTEILLIAEVSRKQFLS